MKMHEPAEKELMIIAGAAARSSRAALPMSVSRSSWSDMRVHFGRARAFDTLENPGFLPTSKIVVLPDTALVHRPPNFEMRSLHRALPRLSPVPEQRKDRHKRERWGEGDRR